MFNLVKNDYMSEFSSYYLYQRYEKRGEQDWIPCYPNTFSMSGDTENPMPFVMKTEDDPACGYSPTPSEEYRWKVIDGYVCDDCGDTKIIIQTDDGTIYINGTGAVTNTEVSAYTSAATSVVITNKATSIAQGAFRDFANMEFCRIPNTVTSIGESAFYRCTALQECQIPNGVTTLARSIFSSCVSLAYMDIPSTVTSIGDRCFASCLNFRYVSWPREVTVVPEACFLNADGMTDIELPSTITEIEDRVFEGCNSLYSVTVLATTPPTLGTDVFNATNENLKIYVPTESVNAYKTATNWSTYANKIYPIN